MGAPLIVHPALDGIGKFHAISESSGTPACGSSSAILDTRNFTSIHVLPGQERVHGIVCRRCLNAWRKETPS